MGVSAKENLNAFFNIADGQEGYFTTKQAKLAGYSDASIVRH